MDYFVFQTYFVYTTLALLMIALCWMSAKEKNNWWMIAAIAVYGVVFAVRYGVGVDSPHYLKSYLSAVNGFEDFNYKRWEPLFRGVSGLLAQLHFPHTVFFFVWAFVPLLLIFLSVRKERKIYPYLAFTFMFGAIWLSYANGLRQIMAFGFIAYAIPYLYRKKWLPYLVCVVLAILSHKSAAIMLILPLMYFKRHEYFRNRLIQMILLAVSIALMNINVVQSLWKEFDALITFFEYDFYENTEYLDMAEIQLGLGFYINLAINLMIVYYSNLTKKTFPNTPVTLMYDLTFIGLIANYVFLRVQLIGRLNYYFYGFNYIMGAFTLYTLLKEKRQYAFIAMVVLYILVYVATLYRMDENTALFKFYWDVFRF